MKVLAVDTCSTGVKLLASMQVTLEAIMSDYSACGRFVVVRIVVVVPQDDWGWGDVAFTGSNGPSHTPTLDRLAADGVVLEQHYVFRYCSPTRGSFLSGRLPHHDHQSNPGGESAFGPDTRMTLLPAKLAAAGYRTAMRGSASCPCTLIPAGHPVRSPLPTAN